MAEILITQFLRPDRRKAIVRASIPDELVEIAETLEISCETLPDLYVAIYAHRKTESEEDELSEICNNRPGPNNPANALERLIRRFEKKPFKPVLED